MGRLDSLRALVTGGTSGIGAAIVERLRADGALVVLTGRDEARGAAVARASGAAFVRADATDRADVDRSVAQAVALLGGLDALVLNAGVYHEGPLSRTSDEAWDALLDVNVLGPYRYALACLPELARTGRGAIALVASDAGVWGETGAAAYSVSKRAAVMLAQMLAVEAGPRRIRVNAVCPGDTAPGMATLVEGRAGERDPSSWPLPPLGRVGAVLDTAGAVAFLLSADAAFCSGAALVVDGGMRAALDAAEPAP